MLLNEVLHKPDKLSTDRRNLNGRGYRGVTGNGQRATTQKLAEKTLPKVSVKCGFLPVGLSWDIFKVLVTTYFLFFFCTFHAFSTLSPAPFQQTLFSLSPSFFLFSSLLLPVHPFPSHVLFLHVMVQMPYFIAIPSHMPRDSRCPALLAFILSWDSAMTTVHHFCPLCNTLKASPWVPDEPCSPVHKGDPLIPPHSCSPTRPVSHLTFSHTPYTSHP